MNVLPVLSFNEIYKIHSVSVIVWNAWFVSADDIRTHTLY